MNESHGEMKRRTNTLDVENDSSSRDSETVYS